jgi:hypothetical protein
VENYRTKERRQVTMLNNRSGADSACQPVNSMRTYSHLEPIMPIVRRDGAGIEIAGECLGIGLQPATRGTVRVRAATVTGPTGPWVWLGTHAAIEDFVLDDIVVDDARIDCWRAPIEEVPSYREGFTVLLEPGMADALRTWLPQMYLISIVAEAVVSRILCVIGRLPAQHEFKWVIAPLVSSCVLDHRAPDAARAAAQWSDGRAMFAPETRTLLGLGRLLRC